MLSTRRRTVFISGSAYEYGRFGDTGKGFIQDLSKALLKNEFKLISGFGSGVGNYVVDAALEEVYQEKKENITNHLQVFPFPSAGRPETIKTNYRVDLISQAGVAIFVFGNKLEEIAVREADGMLEEFEIAKAYNALLIPVGASGYASEKLWRSLIDNFDSYFETREKFQLYLRLGDPYLDTAALIATIIEIAR